MMRRLSSQLQLVDSRISEISCYEMLNGLTSISILRLQINSKRLNIG